MRVLLRYLCVHGSTYNDQILHGNKYGEGCLRRSATPLHLHKCVARFVSESCASCHQDVAHAQHARQYEEERSNVSGRKETVGFPQAWAASLAISGGSFCHASLNAASKRKYRPALAVDVLSRVSDILFERSLFTGLPQQRRSPKHDRISPVLYLSSHQPLSGASKN